MTIPIINSRCSGKHELDLEKLQSLWLKCSRHISDKKLIIVFTLYLLCKKALKILIKIVFSLGYGRA
ncbi:Hypothetical protein AKI40_1360 [Enterobacter sp. FY-07]|nr:Hypothetical protein AKI40_1360 [Enterobacter sp. FY-07]